ncbi:MAG: TetR/AcrR family transcriptional regulator, partial [Candidatus Deferrimicrobiaceae bacterium]
AETLGGGTMAAKQGNRVRGSDVAARERLLKSATGLFTRKGYSGTTVREIVAAAGVTKPVLYYYFRNKEGIYLELMRGGFSRFDSLLGESVAAWGTVSERLTRLCIQTFSLFVDHIDVARVMYAIYYGPPQGAPFIDFDAYHRKFQDVVRRLIREGIRRGEFEKGNVDDMMWAIIGAVNVASESLLCQPGDALGRKDLERVLRIIYRGIAATGGSRTPRGKGGGK